ncbi:MAG: metallophosphoesterase [Polyangiaceae bacterium]|nr:metallophosphoesterase [Polyangiaceae bacterium]
MLRAVGAKVARGALRLWGRDVAEYFEVRRFAGPRAHVSVLDGVRIVHVTDLHVGTVTPIEVHQGAVRVANSLVPDLVAITGDFVCHSQLHLAALSETIRAFAAPVVCVLGNHDHWAGAAEVERALVRGGAAVLANATTTITIRHQRLQIVGLDDAYTGQADRDRAIRGLRRDLPSIGLSHLGEEADGLWAAGVPLVLSGHTHAGQVTVARLHELVLGRFAGHRYVHGLYGSREVGGSGAVYVGAGVGAAVVPFRFGERARREITLFELGRAPGAFAESHPEQCAFTGRPPSPERCYRRAATAVRREQRRLRAVRS